jgi:transposase
VLPPGRLAEGQLPEHGPTVAQVPWARHGAGHTRDFDDTVAWLVTHTPEVNGERAAAHRLEERGAIIERVVADGRAAHDPFDGLTRIGIDEISYKRGHRYLTICVDHTPDASSGPPSAGTKRRSTASSTCSGRALCADPLVSADAAEWIGDVVAERCRTPRCASTVFTWCLGHRGPRRGPPRGLERGPQGRHVHPRQRAQGLPLRPVAQPRGPHRSPGQKLAWIAKVNTKLYRAYLMKEQLRIAIRTKGVLALTMLDEWLAWAQRCRIPAFVELGARSRRTSGASRRPCCTTCPTR